MNATSPFSACLAGVVRPLLVPVLLIAAVVITGTTTIRAATIGVNFAPVVSGQTLPSGTSAGLVPQTNWQNITSTTTNTTLSSTILSDNTGTATTATLTGSAPGGNFGLGWYQTTAATSGGDEWLMDTFVSASGTMSFTISSIPYTAYDLILYNLPLFNNVKYTYTLGGTSYYGNSPADEFGAGYVDGNSGTPFTYTQATSTDSLNPTPSSTYARFNNLSGSSQTFSLTGANGIAYLNGFQIVESVPEPSRAMLLLAGFLGLVGRRIRRSM